jgi:hypothetical protein
MMPPESGQEIAVADVLDAKVLASHVPARGLYDVTKVGWRRDQTGSLPSRRAD